MPTLKERILELLRSEPGLTDRELTDRLVGKGSRQQPANNAARDLCAKGQVVRRLRRDGKIGNYCEPVGVAEDPEPRPLVEAQSSDFLSEDNAKLKLQAWLEAAGWQVRTAMGRAHGIDIDARRDGSRWIIEVKGQGTLNAMRVNYFLGVMTELLQRMKDPEARYSIALPDIPQFRGLWERLPAWPRGAPASPFCS